MQEEWCKRLPNTCCSKKILLLLLWHALFVFSLILYILSNLIPSPDNIVYSTSVFFSYSFAPLIGWLADVRFGRYEVIKFASVASILASILCCIAIFTGSDSTLNTVLSSIATVIICLGFTCYAAAMLPFLTDQIVGATSDELSAVVRWYYWVQNIGLAFSNIIAYLLTNGNLTSFFPLFLAIPFALIIVSDCLCQQWLDRTHKVTNPIKLTIQVLNYTRKHRYPERRSAFTYIDEEQPTRMDYGKEKFGGPFTEEEVEDVKTVLRLLPLVMCLSLSVSTLEFSPIVLFNIENIWMLNEAVREWLFPLLLIPLYQLAFNIQMFSDIGRYEV